MKIFLVGWDDTIGSFVEKSYPEKATIDSKGLLQYLMTIKGLGSSSNIQITESDKNVLIYTLSASKRAIKPNFGFIVISLQVDEIDKLDRLKHTLS
ncbi:MAG: hypothetical protein GF364_13835, partial [Candidatus Lokiarchaeota archaeon]|nr:hypothetical protein [Candidatus Lokiarchaeota archaeon]